MTIKSTIRTLIIHGNRINSDDALADCIALRALFCNWKREELAQIFSTNDKNDMGAFSRYYQLSAKDYHLGFLRYIFREKIRKYTISKQKTQEANNIISRRRTRMRSEIIQHIIKSGIYDLLFPPKLSNSLIKWIEDFDPHIIYFQANSVGLAKLAILISDEFKIPLVVHIFDDWLLNMKLESIIGKLIYPILNCTLNSLIYKADLRMVVSTMMKVEYKRRYKTDWEIIPVPTSIPGRKTNISPIGIWKKKQLPIKTHLAGIYAGSLGGGRMESLNLLAKALYILESQSGIALRLFVVTRNYGEALRMQESLQLSNIEILPAVSYSELGDYLYDADLLFMIEACDGLGSITNRFAFSSKIGAYCSCGKPCFILGNPDVGSVYEALKAGWAEVCTSNNPDHIARALFNLLSDPERLSLISFRSKEYWEKHLSPIGLSDKLRRLLEKIVYAG